MRLAPYLPQILATLVALAACSPPADAPPPAGGPADAAASATLLLAPEDLLTLAVGTQSGGPLLSGTLQPARRADVRAELGAVVMQVLKDNGERVRRGELLLRLDDTSLRDTLASAEAAARTAADGVAQAERQLERQRTLQRQGMTTTAAAEDAELRRNNAQSEVVAAQARVVAARQQLQRTQVTAPFDGIVTEKRVSVGDTVQVGRELLKVIDPATMRLEAMVSADRMHELQPGQAVSFRVNGFPQQRFRGTVSHIDPTANAATRQVSLVVDFADPASAPRVAGLFAEGRVETGVSAVLRLAEASLVRQGAETFAWRVAADRIEKAAVQLGERDARTGEVEIVGGLQPGDRILRRPGSALVVGQKVEFAAAGTLAASAPGLAGTR